MLKDDWPWKFKSEVTERRSSRCTSEYMYMYNSVTGTCIYLSYLADTVRWSLCPSSKWDFEWSLCNHWLEGHLKILPVTLSRHFFFVLTMFHMETYRRNFCEKATPPLAFTCFQWQYLLKFPMMISMKYCCRAWFFF